MQDYRRRRNSKQDALRALVGMAGVLALAFLAFFAARGAWGMYGKFVAASDADAAAKIELEELRGQYEQLGASVHALQSDRGVEAGVRERYGVARPGEGQIDIVRRQGSTTVESKAGKGFFGKIFDALFVW